MMMNASMFILKDAVTGYLLLHCRRLSQLIGTIRVKRQSTCLEYKMLNEACGSPARYWHSGILEVRLEQIAVMPPPPY